MLAYKAKELEDSTVKKMPKQMGKAKEELHFENMESMPAVK